MDYVEGLPLTKYAGEHQLSIDERLKLFLQICAAVAYAHQNLVIHRDLKPSNILVRAEKFITRNKAGGAAGTEILLLLVGGFGAAVYQARKVRRQRDKAEHINKFLQKMLASADPREQGKDVKVIQILKLAAQNIEKDFSDAPEIAADLRTTIGLTFLSLGQLDSAETQLGAALAARKSLFGLENHETAMSLNNFGCLRQAKGEMKEAEELFRGALAVLRRVRRTDVLEIASVLGNLGYLLMLEAKYDEVKRAHHEELNILRERLGEAHPEFARTLSNLANIYSVTGDKQTAEPMQRKALGITERFYDGEHPDVALAMLHLAITVSSVKPGEAESLFRRTLSLRRKFFGDGHTETAWSLYYLGDILHRKGEYEQAADCAREILSWRTRSIPETHSVINSTLIMLARCYLATDRPDEAETLLHESLLLRQKTLPAGHWLIATTKGYLAESFLQRKDLTKPRRCSVKVMRFCSTSSAAITNIRGSP
jgi:tetratricopeptide (TPR) repeat protein